MWRLLLYWTFEIYKNGKCYKRRVVTIDEGKRKNVVLRSKIRPID